MAVYGPQSPKATGWSRNLFHGSTNLKSDYFYFLQTLDISNGCRDIDTFFGEKNFKAKILMVFPWDMADWWRKSLFLVFEALGPFGGSETVPSEARWPPGVERSETDLAERGRRMEYDILRSQGPISVTLGKKLGEIWPRDFGRAYLCNGRQKVGR